MTVEAGGISINSEGVLASHTESLQGIKYVFGLVMLSIAPTILLEIVSQVCGDHLSGEAHSAGASCMHSIGRQARAPGVHVLGAVHRANGRTEQEATGSQYQIR